MPGVFITKPLLLLSTLTALTTTIVFSSFASKVDAASPILPYSHIRSITYYDFPANNSQRLEHLKKDLPAIKATGFNTIWLVSPWAAYNPQPLSNPPVYNNQEFETLKQTLDLLRENNLHAILGLNYLGQGWAPEGIDFCGGENHQGWIENPIMYQAFERYTIEFLTRIANYSDLVYILLFTENAEPCNNHFADAAANADLLRQTLGSLPNRLPFDLRSKFKIGYHDYNLINLGWSIEQGGRSPILDPNPFDFVSMAGYEFLNEYGSTTVPFANLTAAEIQAEIEKRAQRFKNLYPGTPLIIGETGARACEQGNDEQARVISSIVSHSLDKKYGFNIWGWKPGPPDMECTSGVFGGLAITNQDGSPKKAVEALKKLLAPTIQSLGLDTNYNPWAVWVTGKNFTPHLVVRLIDQGVQWNGFRGTTLAGDYSWLSFRLPGNAPPSQCNLGEECTIAMQITDTHSNLTSDLQSLTLPATECASSDFTCDGAANPLDLLAWRALFAQNQSGADVNGDGQSNIFDYLLVLRQWLGN